MFISACASAMYIMLATTFYITAIFADILNALALKSVSQVWTLDLITNHVDAVLKESRTRLRCETHNTKLNSSASSLANFMPIRPDDVINWN